MATSTWGYDGDDAERSRDLSRRYGSEYVDLKGFRISEALLKTVPAELMFRYNFVPLEETRDGKLAIAIADPSQLLMIDELKLILNRRIVTKVSTLKQINDTLTRTEQAHRDKNE